MIDQEVDEFLAHYGVLGMKWGIRKDRKASREAKSKKYSNKAKEYQRQIDAINKNPGKNAFQKARNYNKRQELIEKRNTANKDAKLKKQGKLSTGQKKALIGAGVAAALIAAWGIHTMAQTGEINRLMLKGKAALRDGQIWFKNPNLARPNMSADDIMTEVVPSINPNFGRLGSKMNCRRCTFAYELRRRGYEVAATGTTTGRGQTPDGLFNALNPQHDRIKSGILGQTTEIIQEKIKAKRTNAPTPFFDLLSAGGLGKHIVDMDNDPAGEAIFKAIKKLPHGARGELGLKWQGLGAHSIAWEIVKGKPVFFDTQSGIKFTTSAQLSKYYAAKGLRISSASWTRLDDAELDLDFLMRWAKNA